MGKERGGDRWGRSGGGGAINKTINILIDGLLLTMSNILGCPGICCQMHLYAGPGVSCVRMLSKKVE